MVILVIFSYPLQAHPCRASLDKVLAGLSPYARGLKVPPPPSPLKYFAMTTSILILSYIVAITVSQLDLVRIDIVNRMNSVTHSFLCIIMLGLVICRINWINNYIIHLAWIILLQNS